MPTLRKRLVVGLASFFTFAVFCTSFAGPLASAALLAQHENQPSGCAASGSPLGNTATSNFDFFCTTDFSIGSRSEAFAISFSARDVLQNGLFLAQVTSQWSSDDIDFALAGDRLKGFFHTYSAQKVPKHLFNSVLTL